MQASSAAALISFVCLLPGCGDATPTGASSSPSASGPAKSAALAAPSASASANGAASADADGAPSAEPTASAASIPPPYDGTLTIAQVMYAGTLVHPFDAWEDAMKTIAAIAGKPTETHKEYSCWAAAEGDQCAYFCIEKTTFEALKRDKKGPAVGSTDNPNTYGPDGPSGNVEVCHKYLGKSAPKK